MEKLKVKVSSEAESKEAQSLFFELGYEAGACSIGFYPVVIITTKAWGTENWCSTRAIGLNNPAHENHKEITLQELRDMVVLKRNDVGDATHEDYSGLKHLLLTHTRHVWGGYMWLISSADFSKLKPIKEEVVKEYLVKTDSGNYLYTKNVSDIAAERVVEIPQGANYAATNGHGIFFSDKNDFIPDLVVWVRESLNDKIASTEAARQESRSTDATLAERQSQYGCFEDVAFVTENIMATLAKVRSNGLQDLPHTHRMALYMIASKMARIVNGDFNHLDSWHDIGGYSKLIEDLIGGNNEI